MRFSEYLDRAAGLFPNHEVFIDSDHRLNFRDACDYTHKIANALTTSLNLKAGAKVAVFSPNAVSGYLSILGVNRADLIWVPINNRNSLDTNIELLQFFDVECLLFHSDFEDDILEVKKHVPGITNIVCINAKSEHGPSLEMLTENCSNQYPRVKEDPEAPAIILATGGTTGPSKGVVQTQRGVEMATDMQIDAMQLEHMRYLVVAPITHAAGLMIPAVYALGGATVMLPGFDPKQVLDAVQREKITHLYLPPTAIYALLDYPHLDDYDFSSVQQFICGSSPIAPERLRQAATVFGPCMVEWYGQSETLFPTLTKTAEDYLDAAGNFREAVLTSTGRPAQNCWVEIMDDDGNILGAGEKGEIVIRGSSVMAGYYKNPEATAEVSMFDWHHTGDMGIKDEDGFITIVDRKKDMIISGGFNVFPVEVEKVLNSHPAIRDCAVIGVPDEKWGEAVKAVVKLNDGLQVEGDELIALCKKELGSVKAPKTVEFWDDLPLSPVGKVLKRDVRETFWKGHARAVN